MANSSTKDAGLFPPEKPRRRPGVLDELREKVEGLERYDTFQNRFGNDRLAEDPKGEYISREEVLRLIERAGDYV